MKPTDLYARTPMSVTNDVNRLFGFGYNHLPEVGDCDQYIPDGVNTRVTINTYQDFCFDGRRTWTLASVKLDDDFVMIIQNAGREGDDRSDRFITNKPKYDEMVAYIKTLLPAEPDISACDVVDESVDMLNLVTFYGNTLDGIFETY